MADQHTTFHPRDALANTTSTTLQTATAGAIIAGVQNTLRKQNVGAMGIFTRSGGIIALYAGVGAAYQFTLDATSNLRRKDDCYSEAAAGFVAGCGVGIARRSLPFMLGAGAAFSTVLTAYRYTNGLRGVGDITEQIDDDGEVERREELKKMRRRPLSETLQQLGEGRAPATKPPQYEEISYLTAQTLVHTPLRLATTFRPNMAEANLKETFYRQFHQDVASKDDATALQSQISALPDTSPVSRERNEAIDECLAGIDRLSHDVKDASSYLPAYDQRTYSEAIKALSEKLQNVKNTFDPPKKFSFRNKKKTVQAPESQSITPPAATSTAPTAVSTTTDKTDTASPNDPLSHKTDTRITLPPTPYTKSPSPTLSHLTRCVVDLSPSTSASTNGTGTPFAALYLRNIEDSVILCGQVAGAVHITKVTNSILVVACRQFRMHASKRVDVYLHSTSRPIFEDCEGLRFAPLPETYMTPDMSQSPNQWNQIDDFKWLKAEPSPHFTILPENERIPENAWTHLVPETSETSLHDTLKALHVQ
ncbi:tubulin folding cofactor c [Stemphylium lycopersici]|uniref:Tubulin folding cofactor c n=1 Tax=Stemphylium lycopersici TaxID=183478 RepID=A0A364MS36_STELY|nr:tubulin folding cofactor c [Stemphylium lycopersici]